MNKLVKLFGLMVLIAGTMVAVPVYPQAKPPAPVAPPRLNLVQDITINYTVSIANMGRNDNGAGFFCVIIQNKGNTPIIPVSNDGTQFTLRPRELFNSADYDAEKMAETYLPIVSYVTIGDVEYTLRDFWVEDDVITFEYDTNEVPDQIVLYPSGKRGDSSVSIDLEDIFNMKTYNLSYTYQAKINGINTTDGETIIRVGGIPRNAFEYGEKMFSLHEVSTYYIGKMNSAKDIYEAVSSYYDSGNNESVFTFETNAQPDLIFIYPNGRYENAETHIAFDGKTLEVTEVDDAVDFVILMEKKMENGEPIITCAIVIEKKGYYSADIIITNHSNSPVTVKIGVGTLFPSEATVSLYGDYGNSILPAKAYAFLQGSGRYSIIPVRAGQQGLTLGEDRSLRIRPREEYRLRDMKTLCWDVLASIPERGDLFQAPRRENAESRPIQIIRELNQAGESQAVIQDALWLSRDTRFNAYDNTTIVEYAKMLVPEIQNRMTSDITMEYMNEFIDNIITDPSNLPDDITPDDLATVNKQIQRIREIVAIDMPNKTKNIAYMLIGNFYFDQYDTKAIIDRATALSDRLSYTFIDVINNFIYLYRLDFFDRETLASQYRSKITDDEFSHVIWGETWEATVQYLLHLNKQVPASTTLRGGLPADRLSRSLLLSWKQAVGS
jgi:hypothetical protein